MQGQHARNITVPFLKKEQVARDTWSFYFDKAKDPFSHFPGQYMRMILPHDNADDRGTSRFFTISSSPLDPYFAITTKIIQSTFKHALSNLQPGTEITCFGPLGNFYLREDETKPLIFLAGGLGVTPFHSMIRYVATKKLPMSITLIVSFPKVEQQVFYEELMKTVDEHSNINVIYTVTHPEESQKALLNEIGGISDKLIRKHVPTIFLPQYYVVGPQAMVEDTKELLIRMSIPSEQIFIENFTGY